MSKRKKNGREKPKGAGTHCGADLDKRFMHTSRWGYLGLLGTRTSHHFLSFPRPGGSASFGVHACLQRDACYVRWLEWFPPNHKSREISKFQRKCLCKYLSLPCQWGQGPEDPVMGQQPAADSSSLLPKWSWVPITQNFLSSNESCSGFLPLGQLFPKLVLPSQGWEEESNQLFQAWPKGLWKSKAAFWIPSHYKETVIIKYWNID